MSYLESQLNKLIIFLQELELLINDIGALVSQSRCTDVFINYSLPSNCPLYLCSTSLVSFYPDIPVAWHLLSELGAAFDYQ